MALLVLGIILAPFYLRNILWLSPTPPIFFRVYTMGRKMVKVKKGATDFEICQTHGVIPLRAEATFGGLRKFKKQFDKWEKTGGPQMASAQGMQMAALRQ